MERLNDIMQQAAQRRQHMQDARPSPQDETPVQDVRPRQPLPRRSPLSEQNARLGQPSTRTGPPPARNRPTLPPAARPGQGASRGSSGSYTEQSLPPRQRRGYDYSVRKAEPTNRSVYQQLPPKYVQEPRRRATDDYYETYPPMPPADAQDEWDDDAAGMRYGDWEGEESEEEMYARPRADYTASPLATRELPAITARELEERSQMLRSPRPRSANASISQPQPPMPMPPAAQPPAQEAGNYHRTTQPLNPRKVADLAQDFPQDAERLPRQQARLASAGDYELSLSPVPLSPSGSCSICKGAGFLRADVTYGHPNFGKPIPCECKEAERADKRRVQLRALSNLDAFRDKSFRTFNDRVPGVQDAFRAAQAFATNPDGWLLLIGRNGSGKTHLAAAIANYHLEQGSLVLFATVPDLLDHLRATFAPTSTVVYDQLFSTMREAELLVLDDLGSEQNSSWASEKLFQLLNYRYNSRFPTVITTNNMRLQAVDERIRSRLMDRSLVIEVTMERAQDYRPHNPRRV